MNKILIALLLSCSILHSDDYFDNDFYYEDRSESTAAIEPAEEVKDPSLETEEKSPHSFKGSVSFVTDYRFRGISQTMRQPAVQGTLDYSHSCGFYLGTFGSNVDGTTNYYNNTSLELDFYSGFKGELFPKSIPNLTYNVGAILYYYPGGESALAHPVRFNTAEFYVELGYEWINVRYWQTLTNYFGFCDRYTPFNWHDGDADAPNGNSKGSNYIEANCNFEICPTWSTQLHIGRQTIRNYHHMNYVDWRATISKEFDWFTLFCYYVGTNANHNYYNVPDNEFNEKVRSLTAQGFVFGITRTL
ncbi:MAG: TorF family putative porin [Parachlamydiales bacterium]|jgi:uncharacterized protein (TIGR02001 family)